MGAFIISYQAKNYYLLNVIDYNMLQKKIRKPVLRLKIIDVFTNQTTIY